jgi:hypothetical protein
MLFELTVTVEHCRSIKRASEISASRTVCSLYLVALDVMPYHLISRKPGLRQTMCYMVGSVGG